MIARASGPRINDDASVRRVEAAAKLRNYKTLHGESDIRPGEIITNGACANAAPAFQFGTPAPSSAFAAQAIAQALRVPALTPLEAARSYSREPGVPTRLIRFA